MKFFQICELCGSYILYHELFVHVFGTDIYYHFECYEKIKRDLTIATGGDIFW